MYMGQFSLASLQLHMHTHTCKKEFRKRTACRLDFPKLPMSETRVLQPLAGDEEVWAKQHAHWKKEDWEKVLFSDEVRISISGSDGMQNTRRLCVIYNGFHHWQGNNLFMMNWYMPLSVTRLSG